MGSRANIAIEETEGKRIYLYTHWDGYILPEILQLAMQRGKERWWDRPYLARIIFCEMTKTRPLETTGYGISTSLCDNDSYPILVVDTQKQEIRLEDEHTQGIFTTYSFDEFCAIDFEELYSAHNESDWGVLLDKKIVNKVTDNANLVRGLALPA